MYIGGNGNVSIGLERDAQGNLIPYAEEKLEVAGAVKAHALKIGKWRISTPSYAVPDYVFEDDYDLMSIKAVEAHIKKFRHLPGVKSAKQMDKEGVSLTDFSLTLLKKIEELTLYIVDQNKKLKQQDENIKQLQSQNKAIEKQQQQIEELKRLISENLKVKR